MDEKDKLRSQDEPHAAKTGPPTENICIICGGNTEQRKCKIICQNCGFTRDCSDP